jgi:hypothetical protein
MYALPAEMFEGTQWKALHTALSAFQKQTFLDECGHDFSFCSNHYLRNVERCAEPGREDPSALLP